MTLTTTLKEKACKHCGANFLQLRPMQSVCGPVCAGRLVKASKREESERTRARKLKAKPRSKWLAECQAIANRIARIRDKDLGCVSCDKPATWNGQWHGSHFRSVGAASAVRFNLWNIHKACSVCNNHLSGNIAAYRPRLIERIGQEKVDWLEAQNQLVRHDITYLEKFKRVMGKRLRRME
jgi:hypothetical protein